MKSSAKFARMLPVVGMVLAMASVAHAENILPSVTALNQKPKNDAVSITYAYLPQNGRLVILSGDPAEKSSASLIGATDLDAGDHRNVAVKLTSEPKSGAHVWAAVEEGKANKLFPGSDERAEQRFMIM